MAGARLAGARPPRALSSASGAAHPVATSLRAVDPLVPWQRYRPGPPEGSGWWRCDRVLRDPDHLTGWRKALTERLLAQHPSVPERTPAGYVLQWYLGVPGYTGAVLFHHARRVPSLAPRQLAFRLDGGVIADVALTPGQFRCLPEDPAAAHPDAIVVADATTLAAALRDQLVAHATRFLGVYRPTVRFGDHTLWAAVTDILDAGLLMAGKLCDAPEAGAADARLVLAERFPPLTAASTVQQVTDQAGVTHWTRRRNSCCFYYALPGAPRPCLTCPRVSDDERTQLSSNPPEKRRYVAATRPGARV